MAEDTAPTFTALRSLTAPGTIVFGYRYGDPVEASVVENWGLVVGEDVTDGPIEDTVPLTPPAARPGPEANRAAWEGYAIAHGMSEKDAAEAPLEELQADRDAKGKPVERPADSAKKADWVAYVEKLGADKEWAQADSTTRADLQAWQPDTQAAPTAGVAPVVGDPVAVAASEAIKGA